VDLPTVAEAGGLPGYEVDQWYGITAPARTPAPVVSALHAAFADALKQPDVVSRLTGDGSVLVGSTPQQFDAFVRSEIAKWTRLIRDAKIAIQ
jgi:tripartite-type tricarboxylate transporter receptor subunit TctC